MLNPSDITLLLVDDEEGIRESMSINLQLDDFNVLTAADGNQAIEILNNHKIDFIISDVRMPMADGIFLLKYVKKNFPELPHMVLISGYSEFSADQVKKMGGLDLISKPPNINDLVVMIKKYCNCL